MKAEDKEFIHDMAVHLNETVKELLIEEKKIASKLGQERVAELKEFWNQELSEQDEHFFKLSLDYWDKTLIHLWARLKRVQRTRLQVGHTIMKKSVLVNYNKQDS